MNTDAIAEAADEISRPRIVHDIVCTSCGCACDDLKLTVEGRRITRLEPPCPVADAFFLQWDQRALPPADCLVRGKPASLDAAIACAAEILNQAQAPLLMGFERATCDVQRAAVEIADRLGAAIDSTDYLGRSRWRIAPQTAGCVTATLGEVAARADLVVYWNVDPLISHPRHMERFVRRPLTARGTEGLQRRIIAVGDHRTETSAASDEYLQIDPGSDSAAVAVLRAVVRGVGLADDSVTPQTGAPLAQWAYLAQRLKTARYAAIFHDSQQAGALAELIRDLHRHTRAVALPLGGPPNEVGAAQVLTWQTGFPSAVDFSAGYPAYQPGEATAAALVERGEVDAALVIAADPLQHYSGAALHRLAAIPTVVFDDRESKTFSSAAVAILTSGFGMETAGEIYRSDGVALPLRAALPTTRPAAENALVQILRRIAAFPERAPIGGHAAAGETAC
ncbi:MAG: formylmethanofuran dehydrogenase subunit B [Pirellulales bacterium]|nr:formylmethanofuran dehydrogenase subunit B [Pirellulales bacterium]